MLLNIHVKNFALIDEADINLTDGLNIITGETGAGKSIFIDAVSAGLGYRIGSDIIGGYDDKAFVSLVFSIDNTNVKAQVENLGISTEYDTIIVSRKITADRSIFSINDEPVTAAKVKALTEILIDIHGQHEHQSLLKDYVQLEIIDEYSNDEAQQLKVKETFDAYNIAKKELDSFDLTEDQISREIDYLKFEIDELKNINIKEGEREELESTYQKMKSCNSIADDVSKAINYLDEGSDNASELIMKASRHLTSGANNDKELGEVSKQVSDCALILSEAIRELKSYADTLNYNPDEFRRIEHRLDDINRIESKYGSSDKLIDILKEKEDRLNFLEDYNTRKLLVIDRINSNYEKYVEASEELSDTRKMAAKALEAELVDTLNDLNFLDVRFKIDFEVGADTALGRDVVTYTISTNPGEALKPLSEVASGGELSRIMLGFKTVLSDKDNIGTLVFDEIDAGISGKTASLVSEKLKRISRRHQVISITHLPQIAAMADSHYKIDKAVTSGRTITSITKLNEDGEIEELARLLGGSEITEASINNAKDLKRLAKEYK